MPSAQVQQGRQARRRLAILRHAEEVTGDVALTYRYYGISRQIFFTWRRRYEADGVAGLLGQPYFEMSGGSGPGCL